MSDSADKSYWIRKAFHDFDESGEGMLTMEGLKCTITALLGSRPTKVRNSMPSAFLYRVVQFRDHTREQCILPLLMCQLFRNCSLISITVPGEPALCALQCGAR